MTLAELQNEYTQKALQLGVLTYESEALEDQIHANKSKIEDIKREMRSLSKQAAELQPKAEEVKND
jgi:chromosome segregation ATPase